MTIETTIAETFHEVFARQNPEEGAPELAADTVLLETGLDSLGFAILVTTLEIKLGFDPFTSAQEAFYPQTFGEFVEFYKANAPTGS